MDGPTRLRALQQPFGGIVSNATWITKQDPTGLDMFVCQVASAAQVWAPGPGKPAPPKRLFGVGTSPNPADALTSAIGEAIERYALCIPPDPDDIVTATAGELGAAAVDWRSFPRCSDSELSHPRCVLSRFDPDRPIRWVQSYSLTDQRSKLVPLVMTHLLPITPAERFWAPISTGTATHDDVYQAAVRAICELIERDAIALTWLLGLRLPRVEIGATVPAAYRAHLQELRRARSNVHLFDATTDFGVPTVYAVEERSRESRAQHVVGCATSLSPHDAWTGALKELVAVSCLLLRENVPPPPTCVDEIIELEHGALYMARAERAEAFAFLTGSTASTNLDGRPDSSRLTPREQLALLVGRFATLGMDLLILDITPADVREQGFSVIRAIAPDLMPLPTMFRSRYLGHRRLYDYARQAGREGFSEAMVNPYPQPFA